MAKGYWMVHVEVEMEKASKLMYLRLQMFLKNTVRIFWLGLANLKS